MSSCTAGSIYLVAQDTAMCREVFKADKAILDIVSYEDSMCVLTVGGILSVFKKNRSARSAGGGLELLNTVFPNKRPHQIAELFI